ncbi:MAG: hypothetical protein K6E54_06255 [Bacteroidaceae bacterium]|nr:hypothetical protein [Bacteroidaceae bacterium]
MNLTFRKICTLALLSSGFLSASAMDDAVRDSIAKLIANGQGTIPTVVSNTRNARGATMILGRFTVSGVHTSKILEQGLCWSTEPNPTVLNDKSTDYYSHNGRIYVIKGLTPSTVYYVRPYAITKDYAVGYGEEMKVITIPQSNSTVEFDISVTNASEDVKNRITNAMDQALYWWRQCTSINNKEVTVYYSSGIPTAEASYSGYLGFGPNASYQATGTALHELSHVAGIGQHMVWIMSSVLHPGSGTRVWLGDRANEVVRFFENNDKAGLTGDNTHMWGTGTSSMISYGINGAFEDTGKELQYVAHAMVMQACGEDGLPDNYYRRIATPSYTFDCEEGKKYYFTNEEYGKAVTYLKESADGTLKNVEMSSLEVVKNDSAAWYMDFDPTTQHYHIKNAATGHYIYAENSTLDKVMSATKSSILDSRHEVQLMMSRTDFTLESGTYSAGKRGYWLSPNPDDFGGCLTAKEDGSVVNNYIDLSDESHAQRFLILDSDDMEDLALGLNGGAVSSISINGYSIPGIHAGYNTFNYSVAPGTDISNIMVDVKTNEIYTGKANVEMPESLPGAITVNLERNGETVSSYTIEVEENLLYAWDGQLDKNANPYELGWVVNGTVASDVVNGKDNTAHFVDADAESYNFVLSNNTYSGRILELPFEGGCTYELHVKGLVAGRKYALESLVGQIKPQENKLFSVSMTIANSDGVSFIERKTIYTNKTEGKMLSKRYTFQIPADVNSDDIVITFENKMTADFVFCLSKLVLSDIGEYDAIESVSEDSKDINPRMYNLQGIQLNAQPEKGIYIQEGKKVLGK